MRVKIQVALAVASAIALAACGDDESDDDDEPKAGSGPVSGAGQGGGGAGKGGAGGRAGGTGGSGGAGGALTEHMCVDGSSETCPTATAQTDGVPCCTTQADMMVYVAIGVDHCGLKFPDRNPCFELAGPGVVDDECPQNLDAGDGSGGLSMWGRHEGCCHPAFRVCGILQPDTGCTLFRASAVKPDGSTIGGMGSGDWMCEP
jgi:hypothetical protein